MTTAAELYPRIHELEAEVLDLSAQLEDLEQQLKECASDRDRQADKHDDLWQRYLERGFQLRAVQQQYSEALHQLRYTEKELAGTQKLLNGTNVELGDIKAELKGTREEYERSQDEHKREVRRMRWQEMIALVFVGYGGSICNVSDKWYRRGLDETSESSKRSGRMPPQVSPAQSSMVTLLT